MSRPAALRVGYWPLALLALAALLLAGISLGAVRVPPAEVWRALAGGADATTVAIVRTLRLPRVLLAALVGAGLGASGAALQGTLRNPLAEPSLLGVSGGAAVGAVLVTALGLTAPSAVVLGAFAGAALAVVVVLGVARAAGGRADPRVLLMAGVIVGAFANAAIMIVLATAQPDVVRGALWWMMGSASDARWTSVAVLGACVAAGVLLLALWGRDLDVLSLGEEPAAGLGVDVDRAASRVYLVASLLAAATVAAAGLVGFVGLIVPHLARGAGLRSHRVLVPGAALAGAMLVVAADLAARTLRAPAELPLGAVTALVGVPFFLARLRRAA